MLAFGYGIGLYFLCGVWGMAITRFPACMLERVPLTPALLLQVRPGPYILCAAPVFTRLPKDPGPISNPSALSPDALPTVIVIVPCIGPLFLIVSLILDRWLLVLYFQGFHHSLDQLLKSKPGTVSSTQDRYLGVFQDPDDLESQYRGNCCFRSGIDVHICFGPLEITWDLKALQHPPARPGSSSCHDCTARRSWVHRSRRKVNLSDT